MLSKTLHTYYQIDNFCWNVDKLFRETKEELRAKVTDAIELNHLLLLQEATTDDRLAKLQQKLHFKSGKTESLDDMSENVNNLVNLGICPD
jgi:regulator of replication initiation timing